jgi:hypothetical protein
MNFVMAIGAGGDHTCVSSELGYLACWGANDVGQSTEPVGGFYSLSLATGHSCGMSFTDKTIHCWGTGWGASTPTPPPGRFLNIFVGDYLNCAQPEDITQPYLCWGQTYEPWY